ncbi:MAG: L,D-transpeptidase [Candidatus Abawacabacteria bacterium]|nr:L,D-transpeptidase [Candidatus Abawacabacteria bacterium]
MKKWLSLMMVVLTSITAIPIGQAESSIVVEGPVEPVYGFQFSHTDFELYIGHDAEYTFQLGVTNTGTVPWYTDGTGGAPLRLATVRPRDQEISMFYPMLNNENWVTPNRIRSLEAKVVDAQASAAFTFTIKAPTQPGKYLFAVAPVIEGVMFLPGNPLLVSVIVDDDATLTEQFKVATKKQILIDRSSQKMHQKVGGDDINVFIVSTGKPGMDTPAGTYYVDHKNDVRYSSAYNMYMDNWMGLRHERYGFRGYGIHKLPYWKLRSGRLYEGESHLGRRVSHGCVRLGYTESKTVYDWAEVGTVVQVI